MRVTANLPLRRSSAPSVYIHFVNVSSEWVTLSLLICDRHIIIIINIEDDSGAYHPLGLVHHVPIASVAWIVDLSTI